jgi:predicted metalloendopeptidase
MVKSLKKSIKNTNVLTRKYKDNCRIGLKPFENKFNKVDKYGKSHISHSAKMRELAKELLSKFAPNSIKPEDDFYDYINYQWLQNVSVKRQQDYIVQVDDFRLTQDKVYKELNDLILEYIKHHDDNLSKNLKKFYDSVINLNSKSYSKQLAKEAEELVNNFISKNNPWELLAYINKDEMIAHFAPFVWSLNPDDRNVKQYRCYVDSHRFALIDLSVYYDDGTDVEYKKHYRNEFRKYNKALFDTLLGPNDYDPDDVFIVEQELFNALGCTGIKQDEVNFYNKVYADEALNKYGFDWNEFSTHLGFKKPPEFFITGSLDYLKCGSELLLKNWNSKKWKTYWISIFLNRLARITKDWESIPYDFNGKFQRGQSAINKTDFVSASLYMSVPFNTFLTEQYVNKYYNPDTMKFAQILCEDLRLVFIRRMKRNTWLAPSTKKYALKKLKHFKFIYGIPENLREDPNLDYTEILYDNMIKIYKWRHQKFIELE